jgi:hypothetical protein
VNILEKAPSPGGGGEDNKCEGKRRKNKKIKSYNCS